MAEDVDGPFALHAEAEDVAAKERKARMGLLAQVGAERRRRLEAEAAYDIVNRDLAAVRANEHRLAKRIQEMEADARRAGKALEYASKKLASREKWRVKYRREVDTEYRDAFQKQMRQTEEFRVQVENLQITNRRLGEELADLQSEMGDRIEAARACPWCGVQKKNGSTVS